MARGPCSAIEPWKLVRLVSRCTATDERRRKRGEYGRVGETPFAGLLGKQIIILRVRS